MGQSGENESAESHDDQARGARPRVRPALLAGDEVAAEITIREAIDAS